MAASGLLSHAMSVYGARNDKLTEKYLLLGQLYDQRQWHQLTDELEALSLDESLWVDRNLLELYNDFVEKFENKINSLRLVLFAEQASKQHFTGDGFTPASQSELVNALEFMEAIAKKPFLSDEAKSVAKLKICEYLIGLSRFDEAKVLLETVRVKLSALEGSTFETVVKSSFFRAESDYYRKQGPATAFFNSIMQYLAHTDFTRFPQRTRLALALEVATAALVSDDVFNFGDVLRHDVIAELGRSPAHKWILDLLQVFNDGDVRRFNALVDAQRAAFEASPTFVAHADVLKQKIALLSFVQVVFERPPEQRHIPFADIAEASLLPIDQVEWLVMRAFSKKLAKGTIDEIEQVVSVTWLMPRILDATQTKVLADKLLQWSKSVDSALLLELQVPELFPAT